jgi:NAD+ synthase
MSPSSLQLDCAKEVQLISEEIRRYLSSYRRRGLVVALSGGIDSSVTAALSVAAVGSKRVFGLHLPDRDSSPDTIQLSQLVSTHFGFASMMEEITPILESVGCYRRQEDAIRQLVPEYGPGWKSKIVIENVLQHEGFNYFHLVAQSPDSVIIRKRMDLQSYLGIVAATNFKQRVRKMLEYYHADRLNYAVTGTPNRLEYDQGFFVKLGDGAADIKPIAHLYKTQVYQLAEYLGVPEQIRSRRPTTDTYSLEQGQDEFYFSLPYEQMDLCLYARDHGIGAADVAPVVKLTQTQVERVYRDIDQKREATRYLHASPQIMTK